MPPRDGRRPLLAVEEAATQLLVSLGMKRGEAIRALLPLSRQVLENFERLGPRAAWTGPLSRGDYQVVRAHSDVLRELPSEFRDAYEARTVWRRACSRKIPPGCWLNWKRVCGSETKAKVDRGNA